MIMAQRNVLPGTKITLTQDDLANTAEAAVIESPNTSVDTLSDNDIKPDSNSINPTVLSEASSDYIPPSKLSGQLFRLTNGAVYSNENPIPVNAKQPLGLVYKVQVGAFRNPLPQQSFNKFAPISGQALQSGVTRYMVGYFTNFSPADAAKEEIHGIGGYNDAFVVAYYNGERISINRAKELEEDGVIPPSIVTNNANTNVNDQSNITTDNNQVDIQSQNNDKTEVENTNISPNSTSADLVVKPVTQVDKDKVNYYTSVPNAAPASQVEIINGLFYTVQIGVYSQPVPASELFNVSPLIVS